MREFQEDRYNDAEERAMAKSRTIKIAALAGAGVLGIGGTAYAASQLIGEHDEEPLTASDLLEGAEAAVEDMGEDTHEETPQAEVVHHHTVVENYIHTPAPAPLPKPVEIPEYKVTETSLIYDEDGNLVRVVDCGTIEGVPVYMIDTDLNGRADLVWRDENRDGKIDITEVHPMDNKTVSVGNGEAHGYVVEGNGNVIPIDHLLAEPMPLILPEEPAIDPIERPEIGDIENNFRDERTNEQYKDDFAQNNPDYNNKGGEQYQAGAEQPSSEKPAVAENVMPEHPEEVPTTDNDHHYVEPELIPEPNYGEQIVHNEPIYQPEPELVENHLPEPAVEPTESAGHVASTEPAVEVQPDYGNHETADYGGSDHGSVDTTFDDTTFDA